MAEVEIVRTFGEELAVATYDRVVITFIRGPISVEYLDCAHEAGMRLAGTFGNGIASLTLVPSQASLPEGPVRERARQRTLEANDWVGAGATVVGGKGFVASAIRSVVAAVTLFQSGPPRKVFADAPSALDWLRARVELGAPMAPLESWARASMEETFSLAP